MVNPVTGDKPIAPSSERTAPSGRSHQPAQTAPRLSSREEESPTGSPDTTLEVDQAQQLYTLENQKAGLGSSGIATPEEARSVVARILEQIGAAPGQALSSQGAVAGAALAHLLESAPS